MFSLEGLISKGISKIWIRGKVYLPYLGASTYLIWESVSKLRHTRLKVRAHPPVSKYRHGCQHETDLNSRGAEE